jgi:hypothetical protein
MAKLDLGMKLSVTGLPALLADLALNWDWHLGDPRVALPDISINNIRLDLRSSVLGTSCCRSPSRWLRSSSHCATS